MNIRISSKRNWTADPVFQHPPLKINTETEDGSVECLFRLVNLIQDCTAVLKMKYCIAHGEAEVTGESPIKTRTAGEVQIISYSEATPGQI
jgi:hypothetical protein